MNQPSFYKEYLLLNSKEFINNYEYELTEKTQRDISLSFTLKDNSIDDEEYDIDYLQSNDYEIALLNNALNYITKYSRILHELIERNTKQGKNAIQYVPISRENTNKIIFLSKKLNQLGYFVDAKKIFDKNYTHKAQKQNTIAGQSLNLLERFLIANEVLQIETKIRTLKISEAEKHNLLSLILGCNIDNAKKIMNGSYDAKVKENLLNDYYKTLNQ